MTIYISLPITGHDLEEQKRLAEQARERLMEQDEEAQVVTPFDVADYVEAMNPKAEYADYMAADVSFIIKDAEGRTLSKAEIVATDVKLLGPRPQRTGSITVVPEPRQAPADDLPF